MSLDRKFLEAQMLYEKIIADLEAKLAEKEEKIEEVKKWWAYQYNREMKNQHQEKISFALEQLEKIDKFVKSGYCFDLGDVRNEIDNQIKQLKEME